MGKTKQKSVRKTNKKFDASSISAVAALITAVGGFIAVFFNPGILDRFFPHTAPTIYPTTTITVLPSATITPTPTRRPTVTATATKVIPRMWGFQACPSACNGQNSTNNFASGTTRVYIQFNYENIPKKADFTRIWTMDGKEWVRYVCAWDGPSSGTETIKLSEPDGLHSGVWEMTVMVNDEILLQEQIVIAGNIKYWELVGTKNGICRAAN